MGLATMVWGRRGGKRALLEWAVDTWQDWQAGYVIEYWIPDAEYPVCPVCWHQYKIENYDHWALRPDTRKRLWMLISTAPAMNEGGPPPPLDPGGWKKAEGCRCWRGYTSLRSA